MANWKPLKQAGFLSGTYNFDKWNIRPDAALELNKLVKVLKDNPTIWTELGSVKLN